jgi:hypothetical protein
VARRLPLRRLCERDKEPHYVYLEKGNPQANIATFAEILMAKLHKLRVRQKDADRPR